MSIYGLFVIVWPKRNPLDTRLCNWLFFFTTGISKLTTELSVAHQCRGIVSVTHMQHDQQFQTNKAGFSVSHRYSRSLRVTLMQQVSLCHNNVTGFSVAHLCSRIIGVKSMQQDYQCHTNVTGLSVSQKCGRIIIVIPM